MKHLICRLFTLLVFASLPSVLCAQSAYEKGWDSFLNNKGAEARKYFTEALGDESTKSDAYLSLALLDSSEDKEEQAFENWSKFYDGSPRANALLYTSSHFPFAFSSRNVLKQNKFEFLQQLENSPATNGWLKALLAEAMGNHYLRLNDLEKAREYFSSTGAMYQWQVLGNFDNTSGGGFNKNWGAVEKANAGDKFLNVAGAEVTWYYPGENKLDGWFYHDFYMQSSNSIVYAQTFVNSAEAQEAILSIGVSGSLKAWVNDALVLSVEDERNCGIDLYAAKVKLNKGANRVLVQLGAGEVSSSNFYARFVDDNGDPAKGLTSGHEYAKYTKDTSAGMPPMIEFYADKELARLVSENPGNMLYRMVQAEQYLFEEKTDEAIELLTSLQDKYPNSTLLHDKLSEGYMRADNQTYSTQETEAIKTGDPDSFAGLALLISQAQSSGKVIEVKKLLGKTVSLYGRGEYSIGVEQWIAGQENDAAKRLSLAQERYAKHPENYSMMNALYQITENSLKDSKAAKQIVEDYCNKYNNESVIQTLASIYMKEGDTERALQLYEERLKKLPYTSGYYLNYAQVLLNMQRYDKAMEVAEEVLKLTPFEASVYYVIANIYKEKGDKANAVANYEKALYYYPGHFNALQQLRLLDAKKEFEDYFPTNDLDGLIAKAGSPADYPEDNSIVVLLTEDLLFHAGGANESRVELAVKILNQAGIDTWKEYMVSSFSGQNLTLDKAEIIKANGQKVKAETNGGHIVFTGLEIGDVLHVDYRVKTYYYGKLSQMFDGGLSFRYMFPTMYVRYMMATPHDMKFNYRFVNGDIQPAVSKLADRTLYKWELSDQTSIKSEPLMPNLEEIAPTVFCSNYPDWKYVREWYQDVTTNKFKADYILKKTVAQILEGNENAADMEKARLFYEYILKNTSYLNAAFMQDNQIPQKASRTLSTRMGDCKDVATLFVAMCREAGIDANIVLVLTRDMPGNTLLLPSNGFNHAIAELNADGKRYLLELTSNKLPFGGVFNEVLVEAKVLSIKEPAAGGNDVLETVGELDQVPSEVVRSKKIELDGDDLNVDFSSSNYGSRGAYIRYYYADIGAEEQKRILNEMSAADYRTKTTLSDIRFENLDNLADFVTYGYKVVAENMIQDIAGMKVFKLVWTDNLGTLEELSLPVRKYPFLNWAYMGGDESLETITVVIPEGMELVEKPADVHLECANATYSLSFDTSEAGVLKATREFTPKTGVVSVEEYPDFNKFMHNVSKSDEKQYIIKQK